MVPRLSNQVLTQMLSPKAVVSQAVSQEGSRVASPVSTALVLHLVPVGARSPICSNSSSTSVLAAPGGHPFRSP
jgi:hypothetical protein